MLISYGRGSQPSILTPFSGILQYTPNIDVCNIMLIFMFHK